MTNPTPTYASPSHPYRGLIGVLCMYAICIFGAQAGVTFFLTNDELTQILPGESLLGLSSGVVSLIFGVLLLGALHRKSAEWGWRISQRKMTRATNTPYPSRVKTSAPHIPIAAAFIVGVCFVLVLISCVAGIQAKAYPLNPYLWACTLGIYAGSVLLEEMLFRGYLLSALTHSITRPISPTLSHSISHSHSPSLSQSLLQSPRLIPVYIARYPVFVASVLSSLCFGILHGVNGLFFEPSALLHIFSAVCFGLIACALRVHTHSIWLGYLLHLLINVSSTPAINYNETLVFWMLCICLGAITSVWLLLHEHNLRE